MHCSPKKDEQKGFVNVMAFKLIQHLEVHGGYTNFMNIETLKNDHNAP